MGVHGGAVAKQIKVEGRKADRGSPLLSSLPPHILSLLILGPGHFLVLVYLSYLSVGVRTNQCDSIFRSAFGAWVRPRLPLLAKDARACES